MEVPDLHHFEFDPIDNQFQQVQITNPYTRAIITFTVPRRYINLLFLNAGAYGIVVVAVDQLTGEKVAIKKMEKCLLHPIDAKRAYREFVLLNNVRHPNVIRLLNAFTPQTSFHNFQEMYLVMEFMDHNLREVISGMRLEHSTLSFMIYQILCGIKHLHSSGIIHRDLKPDNLVVNGRCQIKVVDFGLARRRNNAVRMSEYVVTRFYRAPEVILDLPYSEKVDIWSIGCIFAEMVTGRILFPGNSRLDQWPQIVNILGTPADSFISRLSPFSALYIHSRPRMEPRQLEEVVPDACFLAHSEFPNVHLTANDARDLLTKMLKIDPIERCSVEEALQHPYVQQWSREEEVNAPLAEVRYNQAIDYMEKTLPEWKELIFNEVQHYQLTHDVFGIHC